MTATEIGSAEENLDHFDGGFAGDDAATEGENVSIVVLTREARGVYVMREGGANAGHFVGSNGNANPSAANGDAQIRLFRDNTFAHGFAVVGIVHGFFGGSSQVARRVAGAFQIPANGFFDGKSAVIGTDGDARLGGCVAHEHQRAGF